MFCTNCGNPISDNARCCPRCGHTIRLERRNQGQATPTLTAPSFDAPRPTGKVSGAKEQQTHDYPKASNSQVHFGFKKEWKSKVTTEDISRFSSMQKVLYIGSATSMMFSPVVVMYCAKSMISTMNSGCEQTLYSIIATHELARALNLTESQIQEVAYSMLGTETVKTFILIVSLIINIILVFLILNISFGIFNWIRLLGKKYYGECTRAMLRVVARYILAMIAVTLVFYFIYEAGSVDYYPVALLYLVLPTSFTVALHISLYRQSPSEYE